MSNGKSLFKSKNSEIFPVAQKIKDSIKNDNEVNLAKLIFTPVGGGGLLAGTALSYGLLIK